MIVEIERDIPVPPQGRNRVRSECGRIARSLKVGESVLCKTEEEKERMRACMVNAGIKYATRLVEGGWRVWRVA